MTEMNTENNLEAMQRAHGPLLEVKNLQVDFTTDEGKAVHAVRNSSFSVYPGQWVAIVGESGSGKSTSAMAVLGLLPGTGHVVGGSIKLDGQEISGFKQKDFDKLRGSKMGLVPQDPMSNLNPVWRIGTQVKEALVANNMDIDHEKRSEFAKALAGDEVELKGNDDETFLGSKELPDLIAAAKEALVKIGKSGDELDRIMARFAEEWVPGSETRWRVADGLIKAGVKDDDAWYIAKKYVVGSTMGDRIAVIKLGVLQQVGAPTELYDRPANVFVAGFIGSPSMNINTHPVVNGKAKIGEDTVDLPTEAVNKLTAEDNGQIVVGFRPEDASLAAPDEANAFSLKVMNVEDLGSDGYIYGNIITDGSAAEASTMMSDQNKLTTIRVNPRALPKVGDTVKIKIDPSKMHLFAPSTELRLN